MRLSIVLGLLLFGTTNVAMANVYVSQEDFTTICQLAAPGVASCQNACTGPFGGVQTVDGVLADVYLNWVGLSNAHPNCFGDMEIFSEAVNESGVDCYEPNQIAGFPQNHPQCENELPPGPAVAERPASATLNGAGSLTVDGADIGAGSNWSLGWGEEVIVSYIAPLGDDCTIVIDGGTPTIQIEGPLCNATLKQEDHVTFGHQRNGFGMAWDMCSAIGGNVANYDWAAYWDYFWGGAEELPMCEDEEEPGYGGDDDPFEMDAGEEEYMDVGDEVYMDAGDDDASLYAGEDF